MIYDGLIEKMLEYFAGPVYLDEVTGAKREFFEQAGIVDDDSAHFEVRMAQFLDWYLFTRELSKDHITPVQLALAKPLLKLDEQEHAQLEQLARVHHSLFEFEKSRQNMIYLNDLFTRKRIIIQDSNISGGFNQDEIFEARIIPHGDSFVFAKGFCFHPPEAKKFILKEIKKVRHLDKIQQEALMLRLFKMRYKFEQYKHIKLEFIYNNDSKLRI